MVTMRLVRLFLAIHLVGCVHGLASTHRNGVWASIWTGYQQRAAADPAFAVKSVAEVVVAASTQLTAEVNHRGAVNILPQLDFVVPAILTAIAGKYMSMWKTAPTQAARNANSCRTEPCIFGLTVPTNAFQRTMLDGITEPSLPQRFGSILAPMGPLFRAGCLASAVGYGTTALAIHVRTLLVPSHQSVTRNVNVVYATLYTGAFLAVVSNVRYQMLQGIVEPMVDRVLRRVPILRGIVLLGIRIGNGLLGSMLAIAGMQLLGLQRLQ